ncbi:hypothetical protein BCR36DRAFT_398494 [Piromyces finnis]|uniref:Presequence protease, mitochondrial n=1 Tax=Piromyces finnis TaxID=1754191 RepID=A0A1Y1V6I0_9FUNG|nr:hypothetical protein BCR36DRAFT_398494 [Piromyces finnis]|eukprot:ORX47272.1 hypothetical protein BCR36DRAFT_398494 [Piromyces finnis]
MNIINVLKRKSPLLNKYTLDCARRNLSDKVGEKINGFEVKKVKPIKEFDLVALQLNHVKTGAQYIHIANDDSNNVFSIAFQTAGKDSTGVTHILEHTSLCGSKKYPVRDPFFKMLNRTLATFMNAFTASDCTFYPFSTENEKDYYNLMDVYLDATFNPLLRELDFKQEGWRVEHTDPKDKNSPYQFKGVVYNEMKGSLSDQGRLFSTRLQQQIHPGTTYATVSGGDPEYIVELTYDELKKFHKKHYHPSNSKIFTYGNFPIDKHLKFIDNYISKYEPIKVDKIDNVKPWNSPRKVHMMCPPDPILSHLLLSGESYPMHKALIESNIGSDYSAGTGYDDNARMATFSVGLQGIKSEDVDMVEQTIMDVFKECSKKGFDKKQIEAYLHQTELNLKHKTASFGLNIMQSMVGNWIHGADPIDTIDVNKILDRFKKEYTQPGFFEKRIEKYFLNNKHRLTFVMEPFEEYNKILADKENQKLEKLSKILTKAEKEKIYKQGLELLEFQNIKEDASVLPTLELSDISKNIKKIDLSHEIIDKCPVQVRKTATNGISYFGALRIIEDFPDELRPYLPIYCKALTALGTKSKTLEQLEHEIRMITDGIGVSAHVSTSPTDLSTVYEGIYYETSCLQNDIEKMYNLMQEVIRETDFNNVDKLKTLIIGESTGLINTLAQSGHSYAMMHANASLTKGQSINEFFHGISQVYFMNQLAANENCDETVAKLKAISTLLMDTLEKRMLKTSIITTPNLVDRNKKALKNTFLTKVPAGDYAEAPDRIFTPRYSKNFFSLPFNINFAAKSFAGVPYTHEDSAKLQVAAKLMSTHYLHPEIREKNGAYGGGAVYSGLDGTFSFYSYRDPKPLNSSEVFKKSVEWAATKKFTDREIKEAKLSLFSSIDAPRNASAEGISLFKYNITDDMRQSRREKLLSVTSKDVNEVVEKYLTNDKKSSTTVLGVLPEEWKKDNKISENLGWEVIG